MPMPLDEIQFSVYDKQAGKNWTAAVLKTGHIIGAAPICPAKKANPERIVCILPKECPQDYGNGTPEYRTK
ncbi:MAG: hypothetical protein K2O03_04265 [Lachnospiraceae bacterium]|nr:hypothetical protein [Lachnospiraceae bacterium]